MSISYNIANAFSKSLLGVEQRDWETIPSDFRELLSCIMMQGLAESMPPEFREGTRQAAQAGIAEVRQKLKSSTLSSLTNLSRLYMGDPDPLLLEINEGIRKAAHNRTSYDHPVQPEFSKAAHAAVEKLKEARYRASVKSGYQILHVSVSW